MSLRPYRILLHAEELYTHTLRVSDLVVTPMIPLAVTKSHEGHLNGHV